MSIETVEATLALELLVTVIAISYLPYLIKKKAEH